MGGTAGEKHVFLWHLPEDVAAADQLQAALESAGIAVWRNRDSLWPGDDWQLVIRRAVAEDAFAFVACLSEAGLSRLKSREFEELALAVDDLRGRRPGVAWFFPVRLDDCEIPAWALDSGRTWRSLVTADLFGAQREQQTVRLVAAIGRILSEEPGRAPRDLPADSHSAPVTPSRPAGRRTPDLPDLPSQNEQFTGREELLLRLHQHLHDSSKPAVHALYGPSGAGKTQVAIEYAHRFEELYDFVWWVQAESSARLDTQFAGIGAAMGWIASDSDASQVRSVILAELRQASRWLLVIDNAESAAAIKDWLPHGGGHVLVTSQATDWSGIAKATPVEMLTRSESVKLLRQLVPPSRVSRKEAGQLADALGGLPLAVVQAGAFLAETPVSAAAFLEELRKHAGRVLAKFSHPLYPTSLAGAVIMSLERLEADEPAAAELASLCSFFAAGLIPNALVETTAQQLSAWSASDESITLFKHDATAPLKQRSMALVERHGMRFHALTQAIVRDHLGEQATELRGRTETALVSANPGHPGDPRTWDDWERIMPHMLVAQLEVTANPDLRSMACEACHYLLARGEIQSVAELATRLHESWSGLLGDDDSDTLTSAHYLASALGEQGRYAEAAKLAEDTFTRRRARLGADAPETLASASALARYWRILAKHPAARILAEETLTRRRRLYGDDHPDTLTTATTLATILYAMGDREASRVLDEDTWERRRKALGSDHPDTLISASNLAATLAETGNLKTARTLAEFVYSKRKEVLGINHPVTLISADIYANTLSELEQFPEAIKLGNDGLTRRRRLLGMDHPDTLICAINLANSLDGNNETDRAADLLSDTLRRLRDTLGYDDPLTLTCASDLIRYLVKIDRNQEAGELTDDTARRIRSVLGEHHPGIFADEDDAADYLRKRASREPDDEDHSQAGLDMDHPTGEDNCTDS